jgi:prepilin-type processing-associated H-X9-DG protein
MKRVSSDSTNRAMTLIELLVMVAVVALAIALFLPRGGDRVPAAIVGCMSHLKQIDLGFFMYAEDNQHKFPIQVSITNGGTMEFTERGQTFPHYRKLATYLDNLDVLRCPADKIRRDASSYQTLTDSNLSYFLNADVSTNNPTVSILAGDRNLAVNDRPVSAGLFTLATNMDLSWTRELHKNAGGLGFADGHAEMNKTANLNRIVQRQNLAVSRLSVP